MEKVKKLPNTSRLQ